MAFEWVVPPDGWSIDDRGLAVRAAERSDLFIDPGDGTVTLNAPRLLAPLGGDFQLRARVAVEFGSTYDAGVLLVWHDEDRWAKLCFEFSPDREPMIVSVVARGIADDANAFVVDGAAAWLRISRLGPAYAFHASTDGRTWRFVRYFSLGGDADPEVGFLAQSPTGPGCAVTFDGIAFEPATLSDLRNGT
jgi:regulation of enolase protein 1 (concanavalin A-like superfamily)